MVLKTADWATVQSVLNETHAIWSSGLNKSLYYFHIYRQLTHPWSRKHFRFMVDSHNKGITGSLKIYSMNLSSRGRQYRLAGLGAIYTMEARRGLGFGRKLMKQAISLARAERFDAIYLFSEIGCEFYERFGFELLGARDFFIDLSPPHLQLNVTTAAGCQSPHHACPISQRDIPEMVRLYRRWLRRQPYGVYRTDSYWRYKLDREAYLHEHSSWRWPGLEVIKEDWQQPDGGYAIVEHAGKVLRVLEIVATEEVEEKLWTKIIQLALSRSCASIHGWEALEPKRTLGSKLSNRWWGMPMILPLTKSLPLPGLPERCRFLELDHL